MTHQEMRLDAEPLEAEPTLGQLENQEPQDQIDEEKIEAEEAEAEMEAETFIPDEEPEVFVALTLETVRTLITAATFPSKHMDQEVINQAIYEAAHAYAQATGQPPPLPLKPYSPFGRHDGFETISPQDAEYLRGEPVRPNGTTEPFFPDGEEAL